MPANLLIVNEERVASVLSQPLRLDLLEFLMAQGPATASECARAVQDRPPATIIALFRGRRWWS